MNIHHPISDKQRKQILANPTQQYRQQFGEEAKILPRLDALQQRRLTYLAELKNLQLQSKKLSRQIGQARSKNESCDALITEMQRFSRKIKQLKSYISELNDQICSVFATHDDSMTDHADLLACNRYQAKTVDTDSIQIRPFANDEDAWNHYVTQHPAASLYHRIEWKTLIEKTFSHQTLYFLALDRHENIVGILPLVRLNSRLFGDFMVSMPYFNYGGPVADTADIEHMLIDAANSKAAELGVSHIEYRDDIERPGMPSRTDKVNMVLPLPDDDTPLWKGFSSKLRAQIKRAQREPHQVRIGGHNCLQDFYSVFARNMRDLGTPVYSRAFFANILQALPQHSRIVVVRLDGKPVAAAFLLGHGERMEIPWASTIRDVNHLSINMLLYWEVLKLAIEQDYRYFDFGRSTKHAGTYRFKQQWGAQPTPCYWHYWLAEGVEMPKLNPDNPKYALAIRLWQKMPVWASKLLGPPIVRNLP